MKSALARVWDSVTPAPKQSQEFQPMGGVGQKAWKGAVAGGAAMAVVARRVRRRECLRVRVMVSFWVGVEFGFDDCQGTFGVRRFVGGVDVFFAGDFGEVEGVGGFGF